MDRGGDIMARAAGCAVRDRDHVTSRIATMSPSRLRARGTDGGSIIAFAGLLRAALDAVLRDGELGVPISLLALLLATGSRDDATSSCITPSIRPIGE
jgi:hypothetical protein